MGRGRAGVRGPDKRHWGSGPGRWPAPVVRRQRWRRFTLVCCECGARYDERAVRYVCPACASAAGAAAERPAACCGSSSRSCRRGGPRPPLARPEGLAPFLPVASPESPPAAAGGRHAAARRRRACARELGMPHLWVKDDTRNPSGSTKDRASQLVVAKAVEYGCDTIVAASTGNAATALACLAAAAGLRAVVFVPAAAPPGQARADGELRRPPGAGRRLLRPGLRAVARGLASASAGTTATPPTTRSRSRARRRRRSRSPPQLRADAPDVVVVPTGDGVIISGVAKGFADLERAGLLARLPRLIAVQPEGSGAIARALRSGAAAITPEPGAASVADSLVVGAPRNAILALQEIRASRRRRRPGVGRGDPRRHRPPRPHDRRVRRAGRGGRPGRACSSPLDEGLVDRDERVVLLVTGTGLKDVAAAARRVSIPPPVPPGLSSLDSLA